MVNAAATTLGPDRDSRGAGSVPSSHCSGLRSSRMSVPGQLRDELRRRHRIRLPVGPGDSDGHAVQQAEVMATATGLTEFVGAAVGLNLVFGIPLFAADPITAVVVSRILASEHRGYRRFDLASSPCLDQSRLGRFIPSPPPTTSIKGDPPRGGSRTSAAVSSSVSWSAPSTQPSCPTSSTCTRSCASAGWTPPT